MVVFLESRMGLVLPAVTALICIIMKALISWRYGHLARQAETMDTAKDKNLRDWKKQLEELSYVRNGGYMIPSFVEKCMRRYRFLGIALSVWNRISGGLVILIMIFGLLMGYAAHRYGLDYRLMVLYGSSGVVFAGVALLSGMVFDIAGREDRARRLLADGFALEAGLAAGGRRRSPQPVQPPKLTLDPDEEEVLKDVFSEYLFDR